MITIKRGISIIAVVEPMDTVTQEKEVSGGNFINLSFELPYYREFKRMDYAEILGETYYLTQIPTVSKEGKRDYQYTLSMEGEQCKLGRVEFLQSNLIGQYFKNPFFINDKAETFMTLLLRNIERVFPGEGWKLGYVVDSEIKNISFDNQNCLEALSTLAEAFDTEWLIEGRTIHLYRKQSATGLVMKQGEGEALYSLEKKPQDNSNIVTRLYVYGSDKNLPNPYRRGLTRLTVGDLPYIEKQIEEYGIWEDSMTFDDIFPMNLGTITSVDSGNILRFTDANFPFDINSQLIPEAKAKLSFQTGQLAGYEFEISSYNHTSKTFTINKNTQDKAWEVPNSDIKLAAGDTFFVFDIRMSNAWVTAAEQTLRQKAIEYMDQRNDPSENDTYSVVCNPLYFKRTGKTLRIADSVTIEEPEMGILTQKRIVKLSRNVRQPFIYTCELANRPKKNVMVKLLQQL
ncbi:phage tail protein [Sphingobacterium spiritivorum]|uniref:phage tail protein n=1 Tax=Sphingobacterium spiritivorum TaxID=258 RepID=UPI003DA20685